MLMMAWHVTKRNEKIMLADLQIDGNKRRKGYQF